MKSLFGKIVICAAPFVLSACMTDPFSIKPETNAKLPKGDISQSSDTEADNSRD